MWWFQREDCGEFYSKLCADVNEASSNEWKVSNYHNDACGSVCFYLDNDTETYVQLFAFMTKEDADLEGLEMFAITYSLNGQTDYDTWYGDSRDEACQRAAYFANKLREEYCPTIEDEDEGFEHEGVWVEDITKSSCGRFDYTPEQSVEEYAPTIKQLAMSKTFEDLDALCLFVQNSIGLKDGGNAAMFWSGREDGIQELMDDINSKNVLDAIPEDYLLEYVQSEITFHVGEA